MGLSYQKDSLKVRSAILFRFSAGWKRECLITKGWVLANLIIVIIVK